MSAREPVFFAPRPVALPSLLLCGIFLQAKHLTMGGRGKEKRKRNRQQSTISLFLPPFPETKDCKYCLLCPACPLCVGPGVGCGEGRRKVPTFQLERGSMMGLRPSRGYRQGIWTRQPPELPLIAASPAALGGWGLWVTVELNAWFSEGFGGLLPSIF